MTEEKKMTGYPSIDKPWLSQYPHDLICSRRMYSSINEAISKVWENKKKIIIDYYGSQITVEDFFNAVARIQNRLLSYGMKEGDLIIVSLESVSEFNDKSALTGREIEL